MNMKKILAAGVAATLAVSSLAAVVGAEEINTITYGDNNGVKSKTFDMTKTIGSVKSGIQEIGTAYGLAKNLGKEFYLTDEQFNGYIKNADGTTTSVPAKKLVLVKGDETEASLKLKTAYESAKAISDFVDTLYEAAVAADAKQDEVIAGLKTKLDAAEAAWTAELVKEAKNETADTATTEAAYNAAKVAYDNAVVDKKGGFKYDEDGTLLDATSLDAWDDDEAKDTDVKVTIDGTDYFSDEKVYVALGTAQAVTETKAGKDEADADTKAALDAYNAAKTGTNAEGLENIKLKGNETTAQLDALGVPYNVTDWGYSVLGEMGNWTAGFEAPADYLAIYIDQISPVLANAFKNASGNYADGAMQLKITGVKGTRTASSNMYAYNFLYAANLNGTGRAAFVLPIYANTSPAPSTPATGMPSNDGGFLPEQFLEITKVELGSLNTYVGTYSGLTENAYNYINADTSGWTAANKAAAVAEITALVTPAAQMSAAGSLWWLGEWNYGGAATLGTYRRFAHTGTDYKILDAIADYIGDIDRVTYSLTEKAANPTYAFLPITTYDAAAADLGVGKTILRNQVWLLSETKAHASISSYFVGGRGTITDLSGATVGNATGNAGQTYDDRHDGTIPNYFAGLASQVADFFNKADNGKIIFHFGIPQSSSSTSDWKYGGIPSTEVGIKNLLQAAQTNDFALFVNYGSTTGSLQAATVIDATSGSVEFVIDDILDALGGQTIGTVQDLYYGLNKGIVAYSNTVKWPGMYVTSVELQTDTNGKVDAETDVEAEDNDVEVEEDNDVVEPETDNDVDQDDEDEPVDVDDVDDVDDDDDEDDYVEPADDEDETDDFVDVDDDEDDYVEPVDDEEEAPAIIDDDVNGEQTDNTPVIIDNGTPAQEADANPGTGVALAVVPAIVAAAAMIVSKKRN